MAYSEKVIDHYQNPKNVGTLDKSSKNVGTGLVGAPECGDVMRLQIEVDDATGMITDAKFKTFGCGSAIASSSLATEWLKGKSIDEALTVVATVEYQLALIYNDYRLVDARSAYFMLLALPVVEIGNAYFEGVHRFIGKIVNDLDVNSGVVGH